MPEFLELLPPQQALARLLAAVSHKPGTELVATADSLGRIAATDIAAGEPLPGFARSTVDGYAVRAADTYGAGESLPAYLKIIGEVAMGRPTALRLRAGECAMIHTGGMLPAGANAVAMIETTELIAAGNSPLGEIELFKPVADGENVLKVGEDVQSGEVVIPKGAQLKPADIGGLMALGQTQVEVVRKPLVGILSSGDEVVAPFQKPGAGQVRDVNAYSLAALVAQVGGQAQVFGIVPDQPERLYQAAREALSQSDLLVITAGSSASVRDLTAEAISKLGSPGVLVHGVNVRPGKPTILGVCDGKAVIGLPGNPVSALLIAWLFVRPVIGASLGQRANPFQATVLAELSVNLASQAGREDWTLVKLIDKRQVENRVNNPPIHYRAEPIFGKSNLIFKMAAADGLLRVPADANGLHAGDLVEVYLL